ncbi:MAG TPA: hypothetical protein VMW75_11585, partial [Thermoanaerobaculia bacterium]|nr:hypothetical protein [Thermoanaerobaculia bacterium]
MRRPLTPPRKSTAGQHLTVKVLAELMTAASGLDDLHPLLDHLFALCPSCHKSYDKLRQLTREFRHWDYALVVAEAREAPALWRRLAALPYAKQLLAVETGDRFWTWGFCRLLHRMSGDVAARDPESASQLANLAVAVSRHLDAAYDPDWIRDLQAVSFAYLGNARRLLGELRGAADAFDTAEALRLSGTGYPSVEAEDLALEALLRRDQHRLPEAVALFDRVHALSSSTAEWAIADDDAHDPDRAAEARLHQAWCVYHLGDAAAALALLQEAECLLDGGRHADLALALRSGRVWCALRLGRLADARAELTSAAQVAERTGDRCARLRLTRAEVRIAQTPAERKSAEPALRAAARELDQMDLGVDAALAYLDLANLFVSAGAGDALPPLGGDLLSVLSSRELGKEETRLLLLVQQACENGRLTPALAAGLASELERRRRPSLEWWSASEALPSSAPALAAALLP